MPHPTTAILALACLILPLHVSAQAERGPSAAPVYRVIGGSIVHGEQDTLTPLAGVRRYADAMAALGLRCDLHLYPGLGHLLTRNLAQQESDFDPDPVARADGVARQLEFLRSLGFGAGAGR